MSVVKKVFEFIRHAVYAIEVVLEVIIIAAYVGFMYTLDALGLYRAWQKLKVSKYFECFMDGLCINYCAIITQVFDFDIKTLPQWVQNNINNLLRKHGYEL